MSEKADAKERSDAHRAKWGVPLEEVAGQVSGHVVAPPNFDSIERLANIKRGMEVPLSGTAAMPDVLRKIQALRESQDSYAQSKMKLIEADTTLTPDQKLAKTEMLRHQLLSDKKRQRMEFASVMIESVTKHLLNETPAVDGKGAEQAVDMVKALVLHQQDAFEKMFPEKKGRSLLHPLRSDK